MNRFAAVTAAAGLLLGLAACTPAPEPASSPEPVLDAETHPKIAGGLGTEGEEHLALLASAPISEAEYVARFSSTSGETDNMGMLAEYQEAAIAFPFALPEGYGFLPEPPMDPDLEPGYWQTGSGVAQVFFYWQDATATAAWAAHERGEEAEAQALVETLAEGYDSEVRAMFLIDDDLGWIRATIEPARSGDFEPLYRENVSRFLASPEGSAMVAEVGDHP